MPVVELSEWNFNLLVYFIKQADKTRHPIEVNGIRPTHLSKIEYHRTLEITHDNSLVTSAVITQSLIGNNIDVL